MTKRGRLAALVAVGLVILGRPSLATKPSHDVVRIDFDRPPVLVDAGEETTTILKLRATRDLAKLEVNVSPFQGVELAQPAAQWTFDSVANGSTREIPVRVRIVAGRIHSLSVLHAGYGADGARVGGGAVSVEYDTESPPNAPASSTEVAPPEPPRRRSGCGCFIVGR